MRIPLRDDGAVLDRGRHAAIVAEPAGDHRVSLGSGPRVVSFSLHGVRCQVRGQLVVHARRPCGKRGFEIHHGRQGLRLNHDVVERIFGHVAALRHDHRDRLAHVAELVLRERYLGAGVEDQAGDGRGRHEQRAGTPVVAQIARGVHGDDARSRASGGRIHAREAGVGVLASEKSDVQHAVESYVVHEERATREEPRIFVASYRLTDLALSVRHRRALRPRRCSGSRCSDTGCPTGPRGSLARRDPGGRARTGRAS